MKVIHKHTVTEEILKPTRLSDFAIDLFPQIPTKNAVKKAIKKGLLLIDGKPAATGNFIQKGQLIELLKEESTHKVFELKLDIVFEDEFIALINKPPGFPVSGNSFKTIQNALTFNLKKSMQNDALPKFLPVHRLDNQTQGLLLIAKTHTARVDLGNQFENKTVKKTYTAVVAGLPPVEGEINTPLEGKDAFTTFKLIKVEASLDYDYLALLELNPLTGRTHQLRIHCKDSGFPILGDKLYFNRAKKVTEKGLFLCATQTEFSHPDTKQILQFNIPYPKKFDTMIEKEKHRYVNALKSLNDQNSK